MIAPLPTLGSCLLRAVLMALERRQCPVQTSARGASVNPREHQPQQDPGQKECLPRLAVPVRREQLSAGSPQGSETRLGVSRDARS